MSASSSSSSGSKGPNSTNIHGSGSGTSPKGKRRRESSIGFSRAVTSSVAEADPVLAQVLEDWNRNNYSSNSNSTTSSTVPPGGQVFENYVPVNAYYMSKDVHIEELLNESMLFRGLDHTARSDQVAINITPLCRPVAQSVMTLSATGGDLIDDNLGGEAEEKQREDRDNKNTKRDGEEEMERMAVAQEASSSSETEQSVVPVPMHTLHESSYVVAFRYGSVVFFNVEDDLLRERYLKEIGSFSSTSFGKPKAEDYSVIVDQRQRQWSSLSLDHLKLRCLDMNNIVVISSVLGQSVALDHYHTQVDSMLMQFTKINQEMEQTGKFNMGKKTLFQLVAQNNTTYSDSITKIKLLEKPSEAAWKYAHYGAIWEQLRSEFELEERFQRLSLKLELMEKNVKYFLEILQNRKSDTLEWIIIILIAGEIILCLYDIYDRAQEKKRAREEAKKEKEAKLELNL